MTSQAIDVLDLDNGTVAAHPADATPTFDPAAAPKRSQVAWWAC